MKQTNVLQYEFFLFHQAKPEATQNNYRKYKKLLNMLNIKLCFFKEIFHRVMTYMN